MSLEGTSLGHYEIRSRLGAGGMGEVYLAYDTRLRRSIALKILPPKFTEHEDRLRRFEQEACAASALSHPNIITIYEIGQESSTHFMAMEYVQGETLRLRLKRERMPMSDALGVAVQIADALATAHSAGIMHRDIKPENIMLRPDGYVKVLDFGLAKLSEREMAAVDTQAPTMPRVDTNPGTVMGTAQYMSPEQTRGLNVDARTDIWSLGVVLYEMLAGQTPFNGATPSDVIVAILDRDPPPLSLETEDVPAELERILRKALRKNRDERYQTVKDMALDLKSLRRDLEVSSELGRAAMTTSSSKAASGTVSAQTTNETAARVSNQDGASQATGASSATGAGSMAGAGATAVDGNIKRRVVFLLLSLTVAVGGLSFVLYRYFTATRNGAEHFRQLKITKLTTNGNARVAAISPDGKYVVYSMEEAGKQSLWMRQVAIASNVRIVPAADVEYLGVEFSGDGNFIYYILGERDKAPSAYKIPVLGGSPMQIIAELKGPASISPDGRRLAYVVFDEKANEETLMVRNMDGSNEEKIVTRKFPGDFGWMTWSPDQKSLACNAPVQSASSFSLAVSEIRLDEHTDKILSQRQWLSMGQLAWLADGSAILFTAKDAETPNDQIWEMSYPSGEAHKITNDSSTYSGISLTADSSALVTIQLQRLSNVWLAPKGETKRATQITPGGGSYYDLSCTPDNKILYSSDASGSADIWEMNADGTGQRQLTAGAGRNYSPVATPDGLHIIFHSNRSGIWQIWRMDRDGSNQKQLTNTTTDNNWPQVSADGQWIYYVHSEDNDIKLWKMTLDGGSPVQLHDKYAARPSIAPDGKLIACWQVTEPPNRRLQLSLLSTASGSVVKSFDVPPNVRGASEGTIHWSPDGQSLTYIVDQGNISNLLSQPVKGGAASPLTEFTDSQIYSFDWARDGRLISSRGNKTTDAVLINSQP